MNVQWSGGSRSFAKERLKNEVHRGWPLELDNNNWEPSLKLILFQLQKLPKNSMLTTLWSSGIWSRSEMLKSWISGYLMNWLQIKNIILTRRLLLFYTTSVSHFSIRLWCTMKSGFYITTSDDRLSGWTEKKLQSISQSQICTKKTSWSPFGGLLPVWSTTAFWVLAKTLHPRSMLSKSMSCTKTATPAIFMTMPNCTLRNQRFKSWTNRATKFCLSCHVHLTSRQLPLL